MSDVPIATPAREVGPGGHIRFAVGLCDGLRSSTWKVWTSKNKTDVYIAARAIAGVQKISLHDSGSWSHSFISDEQAAQLRSDAAGRHLDIWPRPPEFGEGWTRGYSIVVPWTELRPWPEKEPGDIVFVAHPGHGYWVRFEIVLVAAGTTTRLVLDNMRAIGSMKLVDQSEVKIVARRAKPTLEQASTLAVAREEGLRAFLTSASAETLNDPKANLRMAAWGRQSDGVRFTADLAIKQPPPGAAVICTGYPQLVPKS